MWPIQLALPLMYFICYVPILLYSKQYSIFHTIGPFDLLHHSLAPYFKTLQVFTIYFSKCPGGSTIYIYNYTPETNDVSRVYRLYSTGNVIARVKSVLLWHKHFPQRVCAVPNMAVFCSSLMSCFPSMLLGYFWMILISFQLPPLLMVSLSGKTGFYIFC